MGILLERLEGDFALVEDLPACANALRRLHKIGLVHGDVNRYNFVVDKQSKSVRMVDFEYVAALEVDEAAAELELESLASELTEETGRGGSVILSQAPSILVMP
jgi:tRNA A-37 threonylcarbamoyl transferase component Bud32